MKNLPERLLAALSLLLVMAPALADQVFNDDVIVQGNLCVGLDCVNGETFGDNLLKERGNNNRMALVDTSLATAEVTISTDTTTVTGMLGDSWSLEGNESANGGLNQFFFQQASEGTYPVLSNGSAIDYDCSMGTPGTPAGTLAEGVQAESAFCFPLTDRVVQRGLVLGRAATGGVAIGSNASAEDGSVALGNAGLPRRLVHVAEGLAASDALVKGLMDEGVLVDRKRELAQLNDQLDMIEQRIDDVALFLYLREKNDEGVLFTVPLLLLPLLWVRRRRRALNPPA